jgi:hypothetical protein
MIERVGKLWTIMILLKNNSNIWNFDQKNVNQNVSLSNCGCCLLVIIVLIVTVLLYDHVIIFIISSCLCLCFVGVLLLLLLDVVTDDLIQDQQGRYLACLSILIHGSSGIINDGFNALTLADDVVELLHFKHVLDD